MKEELFSAAAGELASDIDIISLYEILLGRDPETSFVIEEAKSQRIHALFRSFVGSSEFVNAVVRPVQGGIRLRHELTAPGPTRSQCAWITSLLSLDPENEQSVRLAKNWREFFEALLRVPGFLSAEDQGKKGHTVDPQAPDTHRDPGATGCVIGRIDHHDSSGIRGWALRMDHHDAPLELECFAGDESLGRVICTDDRPDVRDVLGGTGPCGFALRFQPAGHIPMESEIRLVVVSTGAVVSLSVEPAPPDAGSPILVPRLQGKIAAIEKQVNDLKDMLAVMARTPEADHLSKK